MISIEIDASADVIEVDQNGEGHHDSIQNAIDNSSSGDIIFIHNGTYNESFKVTFPLSVIGEDRDSVFIRPCNGSYAILIESDFVYLSNFSLKTEYTVSSYEKTGVTIKNNFSSIIDVEIENFDYGIIIYRCNNNTISNVTISDAITGIKIELLCHDNIINDVMIEGCTIGVDVSGLPFTNHIQNVNINNCSRYGIRIEKGSENNAIYRCLILKCVDGLIITESCTGNKIENSTIQNNVNNGIWIKWSDKTIIANCTITGNGGYGVYQQIGNYKSNIQNNTYRDNIKGDIETEQTSSHSHDIGKFFIYAMMVLLIVTIMSVLCRSRKSREKK